MREREREISSRLTPGGGREEKHTDPRVVLCSVMESWVLSYITFLPYIARYPEVLFSFETESFHVILSSIHKWVSASLCGAWFANPKGHHWEPLPLNNQHDYLFPPHNIMSWCVFPNQPPFYWYVVCIVSLCQESHPLNSKPCMDVTYITIHGNNQEGYHFMEKVTMEYFKINSQHTS